MRATDHYLRRWRQRTLPALPSLTSWGTNSHPLWTGFRHSLNSYSGFPWTTCRRGSLRWQTATCRETAVTFQGSDALGSPVYDEVLVRRLLVADWTHPSRLLLVHLDIKSSIEALEVRACDGSARDRQPHLSQLTFTGKKRNWMN